MGARRICARGENYYRKIVLNPYSHIWASPLHGWHFLRVSVTLFCREDYDCYYTHHVIIWALCADADWIYITLFSTLWFTRREREIIMVVSLDARVRFGDEHDFR